MFGQEENNYESIRNLTTKFSGYDVLESQGEVLALLKGGQPVSVLKEGDEAAVVLSITPFYGERGGQAGDTGMIVTDSGTMDVTETVMSPFEQVVHHGIIKSGSISVGDMAKARVFAPSRSAICRNHTATHLIHKALQEVLGEHVKQAGSLVTTDRMRFDYTNLSGATPEELALVEQKVNEKIWANAPVNVTLASLDEAKDMGATALFDEKYGDAVRVVRVGDYSMELCGGTHVQSAGEIGLLKIISEAGIGAGIRRIEALTGAAAYRYFEQRNGLLEQVSAQLKTSVEQLPERVTGLQAEVKDIQREFQRLQLKLAGMEVDDLLSNVSQKSGVPVLSARVSAGNMETLREMADRLKNKLGSGIIVLGAAAEGKVLLVGAVTSDLVKAGYHAGKLVGEVAKLTGGGGGGRPDMAQAGGKDPDKLESALENVDHLVESQKK